MSYDPEGCQIERQKYDDTTSSYSWIQCPRRARFIRSGDPVCWLHKIWRGYSIPDDERGPEYQ